MSRGTELRKLIQAKKHLTFVGAHNPFIAKLVERSGFDGVYLSGAGLSNSMGVPDTGILTRDDFTSMGGLIARATGLPLVGDADTGFGDAAKTVQAYIDAGFAGLHLEDQVFPKRCGHLAGKEVIPMEEMAERIRLAARARDARDKGFFLIARTDARGATNVDEQAQFAEAVRRGRAYIEAGADVLFPESLRSREEFAAYRKEVQGPLLANMTEFGKTPFLTSTEFADLGYALVIFPVTLFRYLAGCAERGLAQLKREGNQKGLVGEMMSRSDINAVLGYDPNA